MTGAVGLDEVVAMTTERPLDPLAGWPEGYDGLYEVVTAGGDDPEIVRKYLGFDVVSRAVLLIKGGLPEEVPDDLDGIGMYADPEVNHSRFVVERSELAADALEGALDNGVFRRVEA